jgi:hypothetical protein
MNRNAIHSIALSRGEAVSAQTFHKRSSGSVSALGRATDSFRVATTALLFFLQDELPSLTQDPRFGS